MLVKEIKNIYNNTDNIGIIHKIPCLVLVDFLEWHEDNEDLDIFCVIENARSSIQKRYYIEGLDKETLEYIGIFDKDAKKIKSKPELEKLGFVNAIEVGV